MQQECIQTKEKIIFKYPSFFFLFNSKVLQCKVCGIQKNSVRLMWSFL